MDIDSPEKKPDNSVQNVGPVSSNAVVHSVPSRQGKHGYHKLPELNIMKYVINKKYYYGNYFIQNRHDWDPDIMIPELKWYWTKTNELKNENIAVINHGESAIQMLLSSLKSTSYWRNILPDRYMSYVLNFIDIIATRPQDYSTLLNDFNKKADGHPILRAPIAYCLHIIRPNICKGCGETESYKHKPRTPTS